MSSELRNWYLSTLGVTQYIPKGSVSVADSVLVDALIEDAVAQTALDKPKPKRIPKLMIDFGEAKPAEPSIVVAEKTEAVAIELPAVKFRLACWQPVDDLLVIDGLDSGEQPGRERLQLLSNILRAIQRMPDILPQAEMIDWPVSAGGPADEAGARTMLSVFLDARIKQRGVCWVLLMGEVAAAYVGNSEVGTTDDSAGTRFIVGQQRELSGGAKAILTHSLGDMLSQSKRKADTWQAIQCLVEQA